MLQRATLRLTLTLMGALQRVKAYPKRSTCHDIAPTPEDLDQPTTQCEVVHQDLDQPTTQCEVVHQDLDQPTTQCEVVCRCVKVQPN